MNALDEPPIPSSRGANAAPTQRGDHTMQMSVIIQNLATGAFSYDGTPRDRWPLLAERITGAANRVDVVMLCETAGWELHGHDRLIRAAAIWTSTGCRPRPPAAATHRPVVPA